MPYIVVVGVVGRGAVYLRFLFKDSLVYITYTKSTYTTFVPYRLLRVNGRVHLSSPGTCSVSIPPFETAGVQAGTEAILFHPCGRPLCPTLGLDGGVPVRLLVGP